MSGLATAGRVALETIRAKAAQKLTELRLKNNDVSGGYDEFEGGPNQAGGKDNLGFGDERGFAAQSSLDLPEPVRPPLRHIDTYCMPELPCLTKRYTVATLACVGFIISFGMRCNMGMAKLIMKNSTDSDATKFNWTVGTESMLDSSFFWGYLVTQVPGGFLASLYPANRIFGGAIAISSFLNLLVPGALKVSPAVDMLVQVMKGLVEGVTYPACHGIWKFWAPPLERSRLATLAFCGSYAAMVIGMPLSASLSKLFGWTASFYFYGVCGLIWYGFWLWLAFEKPSKHPCISAKELRYIEDSLGQGQTQQAIPTFATTPWRAFFTSMPVYAIIVANFCRSWNFYLLVLFQPRFMHEAFGMAVVETGFIGSLPHLLMTTIVPLGGMLADHLRKRQILSTTAVRKLFNCGGFGMEAIFFLVVANATTHKNGGTATFALAIGVACSGFAISGFNVNHLDIAPKYASILMGMSNGIGTIAGLLVPFFVDFVTEKKDADSWVAVFIVAACVHFFGVTFYAIFCSGELQPWADPAVEEQNAWNAMDELGGGGKPPVPPPPRTMQSEFIRQPSLGEQNMNNGWNDQHSGGYNGYNSQQSERIDPSVGMSYGSTEARSGNPFQSSSSTTNPFASNVNTSMVQPPSTDGYTSHDIVQQSLQQWNE